MRNSESCKKFKQEKKERHGIPKKYDAIKGNAPEEPKKPKAMTLSWDLIWTNRDFHPYIEQTLEKYSDGCRQILDWKWFEEVERQWVWRYVCK